MHAAWHPRRLQWLHTAPSMAERTSRPLRIAAEAHVLPTGRRALGSGEVRGRTTASALAGIRPTARLNGLIGTATPARILATTLQLATMPTTSHILASRILASRILARKARSLLRLPVFVRVWLLPAWCLLGVARLLILCVPFRKLAPHLGETAAAAWLPLPTPAQTGRAVLIGRVVKTAARYTPWESNCFPQAVVARWLLGWYGVPFTLCFGLQRRPEDQAMLAHAWVAAGRVRVTGGQGFGQFTVVGSFVSRGARDAS